MTIRYLLPDGPHGYLSNFSPHSLEIDGVLWPTVEHFFQAMKFPHQPQQQERIRQAEDASAAKGVAWKHATIRADWREVREQMMLTALRAKFSQHPELREQLLATGTEPLIESNPRDEYWGDGEDGTGQNRAGQLLAQVREELGGGVG